MSGQIIEIQSDNRHLACEHGFMTVSSDGAVVAKIPISDVEAVITASHGISYTNNLLVRLAEDNIPFVFCNEKFLPVGFLWSVSGQYRQAGVMDAQIAVHEKSRDKLWKQVVKQKLYFQYKTLEALALPYEHVKQLIAKVKLGDAENVEGQAARKYFIALFGEDFRRDRDSGGLNSLLNYGYIILRSAMARAVMGAGLHPTIGIHHKNYLNPMRLVDDLIEPFRPMVDIKVYHLKQQDKLKLTPEVKKILVGVLHAEMYSEKGISSVGVCMQKLAVSLAKYYKKETSELLFPDFVAPMFIGVRSHGNSN